jgi:hypothetical protein
MAVPLSAYSISQNCLPFGNDEKKNLIWLHVMRRRQRLFVDGIVVIVLVLHEDSQNSTSTSMQLRP